VSVRRYFLGCPIWGRKDWIGELFPPRTRADEFLERYAEIFNAVEGNTTFYGVPGARTVARWCAQTPPEFAFCFKFPRVITHERRLRDAGAETRAFVDALAPLGPRLGPSFVQLPPTFGPGDLPVLAAFLDALPAGRYAVEVRHQAFFEPTDARARLDDLLRDRGVDRVVLDARGLHSAHGTDPDLLESQRQKPDLPLYAEATGERPLVRLVGHPVLGANDEILAEQAARVAGWIAAGKTPHVFLHMPDDFHAPALARRFHDLLATHVDVGALPAWPIPPASPSPQLDLF
jgi:uncharacterized protein YecE (DUF72 family)